MGSWTERRRRMDAHGSQSAVATRVGTPTHISWLPDYEVKGQIKKAALVLVDRQPNLR
jgi:hypothetical protein